METVAALARAWARWTSEAFALRAEAASDPLALVATTEAPEKARSWLDVAREQHANTRRCLVQLRAACAHAKALPRPPRFRLANLPETANVLVMRMIPSEWDAIDLALSCSAWLSAYKDAVQITRAHRIALGCPRDSPTFEYHRRPSLEGKLTKHLRLAKERLALIRNSRRNYANSD